MARFAGALRGLGVGKGDRVIIYMPMIPEALIAMLACARIGAVHSVVFGGFAAPELAARIDDAKPKVIVSASCGIEGSRVIEYKPILDGAIELAGHKPVRCMILQRPQATAALTPGGTWMGARRRPAPSRRNACRSRRPTRCTSCTPPGPPAGPRGWSGTTAGTRSRCAGACDNIYDTRAGEVFWAASDVGWVVGHSYIVYAPLLAGCTTVLYEGKPVGTPDAGAFWRVIAEHSVKALFTAPTAFRAIKKEDPERRAGPRYDLSGFRYLFLAGERLDPETYQWAGELLGVPVIDHWWQTETGWADRGRTDGPGAAADPGRVAHHAGARVRCAHPGRRRHRARSRARPGRSWCGCRCRRAACRRCGTRTSDSSSPT